MATPEALNTGLTDEQISEAFQRALNDMTDDEINAKFAEIEERISALEGTAEPEPEPETNGED